MLKVISNFTEQNLSNFVNSLDRSKAENVEYSPNLVTIRHSRSPIKEAKEIGNITFSETLLYSVGAFSPSHVDNGPMDEWKVWKFTGILFCTDSYAGGELFFPKLNIMMKPRVNTFIMFPAGVGTDLYEHGVHPVISGERITTIFRFI